MTIELEFKNEEVNRLFSKLVDNLTNLKPVMNKIGILSANSVRRNFSVGGAYSSPDSVIGGNKTWQPLSPTTKKIKERKGFKGPHQILIESERLRSSISHKVDRDSVTIGTNVPYAAMQHFGAKKGSFGIFNVLIKAHTRKTKNGKIQVGPYTRKIAVPFGNVPARPFMTIHPDTVKDMSDILLKWITEEGIE